MSLPQHLREEVLMLSSVNFWMCFAGLIYLVAGVFILRKEISAARGWDKLITLGCVFIAVLLTTTFSTSPTFTAAKHTYAGSLLSPLRGKVRSTPPSSITNEIIGHGLRARLAVLAPLSLF